MKTKKYIKPYTELIDLAALGYVCKDETVGIGGTSGSGAPNHSGGDSDLEFAKENFYFEPEPLPHYDPWED